MARLIKVSDPEKPVYEIKGDVLRLGRLPDNEVVLMDALASRRHAEIRRVGGVFRIIDLNSLNGVYVNNLKVEDEQLASGDIIAIGEARFYFEEGPTREEVPCGEASPSLAPERAGEIVKPLPRLWKEEEDILSLSDVFEVSTVKAQSSGRGEPAQSRNFFILYQVARALNASNDLSEILDLSLKLIFQVMNVERAVIFLLNEKGELVPALSRTKRGGELPELTISQTITRRAVEEKSAIITDDACYDPRFSCGSSIIAYNIRSALCVPLWDREKTRGAIYLDNLRDTYAFMEEDLELAVAIANQVAIAVQREEMQRRMRESAVFRAQLERFHSPDVVNHILQRASKDKNLRSLEEREVTILFADIVDFTPLLERLSPQEAAPLLTEFFDEMSEIIFQHKGTIDKFIGDCLMAIFGAPLSHGNDAELALFAAREMMKKMEEFKTRRPPGQRFDLRIGINTGMVVAGYLGSRKRLEYSVLGDPVNVAARLQDTAAPGSILVGEATYAKAKGLFNFKDCGSLALKGKKHETRIYEVSYL